MMAFEHSVVQDTGGIDTDKVEKSTTHKVKDNGGNSDTSIDASPLSFSKVAYGFNLLPTRFKNFYIYDSTIGPEGLLKQHNNDDDILLLLLLSSSSSSLLIVSISILPNRPQNYPYTGTEI